MRRRTTRRVVEVELVVVDLGFVVGGGREGGRGRWVGRFGGGGRGGGGRELWRRVDALL